ncbi:hypothetical protein BC830DRAFT_1100687 [Chytriomyces sp. MP71]|nr:hypothetical protein BC830DRAFT_1100687 [Chytriomyces sp. MP71]
MKTVAAYYTVMCGWAGEWGEGSRNEIRKVRLFLEGKESNRTSDRTMFQRLKKEEGSHTRSLTASVADAHSEGTHSHSKSSTPALGIPAGGHQHSLSETSIADFESFAANVNTKLKGHPYISSLTDTEIRRFLIAHRNNANHALKHIQMTLDWRNTINYNSILSEDFSDLEATGKLTIECTDSQQNAIMIWQQNRHIPLPGTTASNGSSITANSAPATPKLSSKETKDAMQASVDRNLRFFIYTILRAHQTHRLRSDNKLVVIIDRIGMTPANYDQPLGKAIIATMVHFPEQFEAYYVFPKNAVLMVAWKVTRVFLDPVTVARIRLLGEGEVKPILGAFVPKEELLVRYGGSKMDPHDDSDVVVVGGGPRSTTHDAVALEDLDNDADDDFVDAADGNDVATSASSFQLDLRGHTEGKETSSLLTAKDSACSPTSPLQT